MPKEREVTANDIYEIFRYLTVAGHNILYATTLIWELCGNELSEQHDYDDLEMELDLMKSEYNYYREELRPVRAMLKRVHL
jgi:hypothetical protein